MVWFFEKRCILLLKHCQVIVTLDRVPETAPTSFPGSLSYPSQGRVGENPGNEVETALVFPLLVSYVQFPFGSKQGQVSYPQRKRPITWAKYFPPGFRDFLSSA